MMRLDLRSGVRTVMQSGVGLELVVAGVESECRTGKL